MSVTHDRWYVEAVGGHRGRDGETVIFVDTSAIYALRTVETRII